MRNDDRRDVMVRDHLIARGIRNEALLNAFRKIPRHLFVPREQQFHAYGDHPLSIGEGQTISQPYMVALMVELLQVEKTHRVLEIGTGSGYQTAILSELAAEVYTVERIDPLLRNARKVLKEIAVTNVYFRLGDGTKGWEQAYPTCREFDRIVVSAAAPSVPVSLLQQMADGARLVIPTGSQLSQELLLVIRQKEQYRKEQHGGCTFVPLIGEEGWK